MSNTQQGATKPITNDELVKLVHRAEHGDERAIPALREILKEPKVVDLLGGDLAVQVQRTLIHKYSGKNLLSKEVLNRKLEVMRAELAGPTSTPLERLLVERVVSCWLHLHHLEAIYANKDSMALELAMFYQRSISLAHKRYLAAIRTLATVRKLAVPILQFNIAKKQVNIAGGAATEGS